jgi:PAS domain S-box-containing protein
MSRARYALGIAAIALLHVVTGWIGLSLYVRGGVSTLVWAPSAIGLAILLRFGLRWWPGIVLGAFLLSFNRDLGFGRALVIGGVAGLEAATECALLVGVFRFRRELDRVRDVLAFVGTVTFATLLGATANVSFLASVGRLSAERAGDVWSLWWWSHLSGDLIITPAILTWARVKRAHREAGRAAEVAAIVIAGLVVVILSLGKWPAALHEPHAPYLLLPILIWAGLRFGPHGATLASLGATATAIVAHSAGIGHFSRLFDLQTFVAVSTFSTLVLSALVRERVRSLERQGAIQQTALDAIVTVDKAGTLLEMNPAAERLFGLDASHAIGKDMLTLVVPPRLRDRYREVFAEQIKKAEQESGGGAQGTRYRAKAWREKTGDEFPVEVSMTCVPVEGESLFTGFIRDISAEELAAQLTRRANEELEHEVADRTADLLRANQELRNREALLRQAEELAVVGSFEFDIGTRTLKWSDELFRIYGRDQRSFVPTFETFLAAIHPDDREELRTKIDAAFHGTPFSMEERIHRPDGAMRVLQTQAVVYLDNAGAPARIAGCCQDITDRKIAEEDQRRLASLVEQSDDAILGLSPAGVVESWNAAASSLFGYERAEAIGMDCRRLVAPDDLDRWDAVRTAVRTGEHLRHYELRHRRHDGSEFDGAVATAPIRDIHQRIIGIVKVIRDITPQKEIEEQLRSSLEEKEVLLREIHHRVKNNLQVVASLLNIQSYSQRSEEGRKALVESQSRIYSMALVHQLLYQSADLAQIDLSEYLSKLVQQLVTMYAIDAGIKLHVSSPALRVDIDRAVPCGLIVNELVTNALIHACPDGRGGNISVTLEQVDGNVRLAVADDGIGMNEPVNIEALGSFGLQIANTLSQQLDGSMTIEHERGTVIRVDFPLTAQSHAATQIT